AIQNLAEMLAADQEGLVLKRLEMLDMARSIERAVFMDAEKERFEYVTRSIAGMPETLDRLALRLSAGTGIPVTLLMGQSPAGLNATGASDIRLWYDNVRSQQNQHLTPRIGRVVRLAFLSKDGPTNGKEPEDWSISWRPLWQPTEKEQAETRYLTMQTDVGYIDRGVLSPRKVAESRFGGDRWSMETTVDIDDWDEFGEPEPDDGDGTAEGVGASEASARRIAAGGHRGAGAIPFRLIHTPSSRSLRPSCAPLRRRRSLSRRKRSGARSQTLRKSNAGKTTPWMRPKRSCRLASSSCAGSRRWISRNASCRSASS